MRERSHLGLYRERKKSTSLFLLFEKVEYTHLKSDFKNLLYLETSVQKSLSETKLVFFLLLKY